MIIGGNTVVVGLEVKVPIKVWWKRWIGKILAWAMRKVSGNDIDFYVVG